VDPNTPKELVTYSVVLIELLAETSIAEVSAAADCRGTAHRPAGTSSHLVTPAWNAIRHEPYTSIPRALSMFRGFLHTLRRNLATDTEQGNLE
jgi:hypothetical protein